MTARATPRKARPKPTREPPNRLLANSTVRDWYEARRLRSRLSADVYLRQIRQTLDRLGIGPEEVGVIAAKEPERLRRLLIRYASDLKQEGRLDSYIVKTFDGLRSFLKFRGIAFDGFPKLNPIRGASLSRERIPSPEELGRTLERLTLRGRLILLMMAHTGVRPGVLGSYLGERGLVLGDLPEFDVGRLEFPEVPFTIRVPAELSKTRVAYTTFGTSQLANVIVASLLGRREKGEKLSSDSPLIVPSEVRGIAKRSLDGATGRFLSTKSIVSEIREALRLTAPEGVAFRPYVARSYCATRLLLAEGQGRISRDLREAILGHDTGVAGRYTVGKRWGEELLAEARREYANASEFLETNASTKVDVRQEVLSELLHAIEEATGKKAEGAALSAQDLAASIRKLLGTSANEGSPDSAASPRHAADGRSAQKVVDQSEVKAFLDAGARFVSRWNDHEAIIELPMA